MAAKSAASKTSMSDESVQKATGRVWSEWFAYLDKWAKKDTTHKEVAQHLSGIGVKPWWSQMVTVEWERHAGKRAVNQTTRGYEVGVSRTVPATAEECEKHFATTAAFAKWMGKGSKVSLKTKSWSDPHGSGTITSTLAGKRMCIAWTPNGTERKEKLEVQFFPTKTGKTSVRITHTGLASSGDVERRRTDWGEALDRLVSRMRGTG